MNILTRTGVVVILSSVVVLSGCDTLSKKFIRKSKKEKAAVQMVLEPEVYTGPVMTREERYRQAFMFWQNWHDEFIAALIQDGNRKKQIDTSEEALKNLKAMQGQLVAGKQEILEGYIRRLRDLEDMVKQDIYGQNVSQIRSAAERLKRDILRDFSYTDVKNELQ
ncbi:MAG: hypothetical protein PHE58_04220 [Candidatus Omnitrophica bacterium]|nr:hypothetical protein [Candidatus Omnitrophota bacterium]